MQGHQCRPEKRLLVSHEAVSASGPAAGPWGRCQAGPALSQVCVSSCGRLRPAITAQTRSLHQSCLRDVMVCNWYAAALAGQQIRVHANPEALPDTCLLPCLPRSSSASWSRALAPSIRVSKAGRVQPQSCGQHKHAQTAVLYAQPGNSSSRQDVEQGCMYSLAAANQQICSCFRSARQSG